MFRSTKEAAWAIIPEGIWAIFVVMSPLGTPSPSFIDKTNKYSRKEKRVYVVKINPHRGPEKKIYSRRELVIK